MAQMVAVPMVPAPAAVATPRPIIEPDAVTVDVKPVLFAGEVVVQHFKQSYSGCCGCTSTGGNSLTLTDQRIQISYWTNAFCGLIESGRTVESFMYKDMTHITLQTGKSWFWPLVGLVLTLYGFFALVQGFYNNQDAGMEALDTNALIAFIIGLLIMIYVFCTQGKAYVTIDFSKNMPISSWMFTSGWPKWLRLSAIWGAEGGARTAYTTRSVLLSIKDAEQATSMLATRAYE